jgi:hypothetical protein
MFFSQVFSKRPLPKVLTLLFMTVMASSCYRPGHERQSSFILFEGSVWRASQGPKAEVRRLRELIGEIDYGKSYDSVAVSYPFEGSVFPPEMVAPTFRWNDQNAGVETWMVAIGFDSAAARIYILTDGKQSPASRLDSECIRPTNRWEEPPRRTWTPDSGLWHVDQGTVARPRCARGHLRHRQRGQWKAHTGFAREFVPANVE